jgi:hypothetical protein
MREYSWDAKARRIISIYQDLLLRRASPHFAKPVD